MADEKEILIQEIGVLRAGVICNDAETCTSYEEEIASLVRRGGPNLYSLSVEELIALRDEALASDPYAEDEEEEDD